MDRYFIVELGVLDQMVQQGGQNKLESLFLAILPDENHAISLEKAKADAEPIVKGELAKFVGGAVRGHLQIANGMIDKMLRGHAPALPSGAGNFLLRVWARLPFFARLAVQGNRPGEEKVLLGEQAVRHQWKTVKGKTNPSLKELEMCVVFGHLLPDEDAKQAKDKVATVYKVANKKSKNGGEVENAKQKKKQKNEDNSLSAAAAFFKN